MLGGETKEGKPMPLFTLCALLEAAEIPWSCGLCASAEDPRIFDRGDGVIAPKDQYVCPICKGSGDILTDTDYFPGVKCNIRVIVEKNLKGDRNINSIVGYLHP
jgi:hypothetical protein